MIVSRDEQADADLWEAQQIGLKMDESTEADLREA
jgi:hypothetical protein